MNHFRQIELNDKSAVESIFKPYCLKYDLKFCEYSFGGDYLFREEGKCELLLDGEMKMRAQFKEGGLYLIPTLPPKELALHSADLLKNEYSFFPVTEQWLSHFDEKKFQFSFNRNDSDYIFCAERLRSLAGRALSSRRNLIHQLEAKYRLISKPIETCDLKHLYPLLDKWLELSQLSKEQSDYYQCRQALDTWGQLSLFGRVVYANSQAIGFIIGECLTPITVIMAFAKSRLDIKGVTPYLYRDFAKSLPTTVKWINMEQDEGDESLRQAKKAYHPEMILTKWRVKQKE